MENLKIEAHLIWCPECRKFVKLIIDHIEPIELLCGECCVIIATIKQGK